MIETFRDLRVWQVAIKLVTECYRLSRQLPDDERFGLTSQLRRAAVSVPANIAEGHGRGTTNAYINYLWIANGSLTELETHLVIAERLSYVSEEELAPAMDLIRQTGHMLVALRRSLESRKS